MLWNFNYHRLVLRSEQSKRKELHRFDDDALRKLKKTTNRHILYFTIICLFVFITTIFKLKCPFIYLTGLDCPTCGVTRACLSLLKLDINGYFHYHPLAIPLVLSVLFMIHVKHLKHKWIVYLFITLTLIANTILYIEKIFF